MNQARGHSRGGEMEAKITAEYLQNEFYRRNSQRFDIIAPNIYIDWSSCEMDLFCLRKSGFVDEIEIKLSRADFLADFKKTVSVKDEERNEWGYFGHHDEMKHDRLRDGKETCNRFSFLMPESIADKCEIPEYAGLYVLNKSGRWISEIKSAPLLHRGKLSDEKKYQIGRKMAFRYWRDKLRR
jgi:hypothetical protein